MMSYLADRGCRCVAYDQRGHGDSGGGRHTSVTAFGEDTVEMISQLRMPLVVGASLGGFAALLALSDPSVERRVAGLVLVDVVPDPDPDRTRRFLAPLGMDQSPLVEDILGRRDRLRKIAASLTLPVLAIRAGERTGYSDDDADRFAKLVPHAAITVVAGAGTWLPKTTPSSSRRCWRASFNRTAYAIGERWEPPNAAEPRQSHERRNGLSQAAAVRGTST